MLSQASRTLLHSTLKYISFQFYLENAFSSPSHTSLVFSVLSFRPEVFPNISSVFMAANRDSLLPSKIKVMSLAGVYKLLSL